MRVPKNWNELNVGMYQELYPTFEKEYKEPIDKIIEQIGILTDMTQAEVEGLTVDDMNEFSESLSFLSEPVNEKIYTRFKINKQRYKFEPDAMKLNGGAYMTAMHLAENDPNTQLHQVLFNIAIPCNRFWKEKKVDRIKFYNEHIEDFKLMPMSVAFPIVSFFLTLCKDLTTIIEDSFDKTLMTEMEKLEEVKKDLESVSVG